MGPMGDSASLKPDEAPSYCGRTVPPVEHYRYLGVILDRLLTFKHHFASLLARGASAFDDFLGAANSLGLPVPLQAAAIPTRIASSILYGLEFCVTLPSAESDLNRLQANWAKSLLGCRGCSTRSLAIFGSRNVDGPAG